MAAAAGNCKALSRVSMILPAEAICWPPITPMVTKSPITMVTTKIEPMTMPGLASGNDDVDQRLPAGGAGIIGGLDQPLVDADHRVEDRHHHEESKEVNQRQHHGEFGEQQPFERLMDQADALKRPVDQAVAAEQRNPRDHADHVRGPERNGAEQRQHDLPGLGADVEGEEISDGEADQTASAPRSSRIISVSSDRFSGSCRVRADHDAAFERSV